MNSFEFDENNEEILLSKNNQQVMMEWEKPYMEQSIDFLHPKGDVLEIGFGCGYSATQILKHSPKSYTVIECDPVVIEKAKKWRDNYLNIPIYIIEGTWQQKLHTLEKFDEIYFDDFPLDIKEDSQDMEKAISAKRINIFTDLCIQNHTKIGSKISFYLNGNQELTLSSDTHPFVKVSYQSIPILIPETCKYRDISEQKCLIPLVTKVRDYSFEYANKIAQEEIMNRLKGKMK